MKFPGGAVYAQRSKQTKVKHPPGSWQTSPVDGDSEATLSIHPRIMSDHVATTKESQSLQAVGRLGAGAEAKGAVQKAMGQNTTVDGIWDDFCALSGVKVCFLRA